MPQTKTTRLLRFLLEHVLVTHNIKEIQISSPIEGLAEVTCTWYVRKKKLAKLHRYFEAQT